MRNQRGVDRCDVLGRRLHVAVICAVAADAARPVAREQPARLYLRVIRAGICLRRTVMLGPVTTFVSFGPK